MADIKRAYVRAKSSSTTVMSSMGSLSTVVNNESFEQISKNLDSARGKGTAALGELLALINRGKQT